MNKTNSFNLIYHKMNSDSNLPPGFPYIVDIELTNKCNLNCSFCSRQLMKREQGFMNLDVFNKTINECKKYGTGIRFIRWGEPFLHSDILNYIKIVKDNGLSLHITTNGLLLNREICEQLVTIRLDSITFSIQGLTKDEYKMERRADLFILYENIKLLSKCRSKKKKPYITISVTYTPEGNDEDQIKELAFKDEWEPYVDNIHIGITNYARISNFKGKHIICKEPWQKLSVDWDGNVSACCGDYDRLLNIGNINNDTLYNLWHGELIKSYRKIISSNKLDSLSLCNKCYPSHGNVWRD